jgi:hypothetical protein
MVGWAVTLKCTIRRVEFLTIRNTWKIWQVIVGPVKKSIETISWERFFRKAFQLWDGGYRPAAYLATGLGLTSMPSFSSSP